MKNEDEQDEDEQETLKSNTVYISPNSLWGNNGTEGEQFYIFDFELSTKPEYPGRLLTLDSDLNYYTYTYEDDDLEQVTESTKCIISRVLNGSQLNQSSDLNLSDLLGHKALINDGASTPIYED